MKILTNKKTIQKIIIAIVIILSFNFIVPNYSQADFGGVLFGPIIDFMAKLGDSVLAALQYFMYDGATNTGGSIGGAIGGATDGAIVEGGEEAGEIIGGAIGGAITFINPFDTFLVDVKDFNSNTYGMNADGENVDYTINEDDLDQGWFGLGTYQIPIIKYSPNKIFANKVPSLDVNFIKPQEWNNQKMNEKSVTQALHSTIANWYVALRNLAIVSLLSVLLYIGIRIIISSTASDKAKYKQMIIDWVIALCIVFFLHYIMSFILTITNMITEGMDTASEIVVKIDNGANDLIFKTDLTGLVRMQVQYKDLGIRMIYLIFYLALVIYTVMFTWTYVKRAITMAFLTLMAPLVAITYPIDKINDGKAQAYGIWFKEFVFNALLQPFHLIIYTIFLGSASEIAVKNPIYAILFLAFIIPSEKLLKKMFGFEKSNTAGSFAAGVGGAAAFNLISKGVRALAGGGNKNKPQQTNGNNRVRTSNNTVSDSAPQGYEAFADSNSRSIPSRAQNVENQHNENPTAQQRMVEAYDENYGTNEWDPQERDAMAREAYEPQSMNYSADEYEQILRDSGYEENEIREMINNDPRYSTTQAPEQEQVNNQTQSNRQDPTRGQRIINGFASLGRATFNGRNARRLARFAGRAAVRTVTTGMGATIGLAAGITGGDLSDVITYGIAGTALGNRVLGNAALNGISGVRNVGGNIAHTFNEGYYGVNEAAVRQQTREFNRNEDMRRYLSEEFSTENDQRLSGRELNNLMDRASYYNNVGITEKSNIKKSLKLEDSIKKEMADMNISDEEKTNLAREQSATIAKIADNVDDKKLMSDDKYAQGLHNNFKRGLKKANASMNESDIEKQADHMMKLLKQYKKID